MKASYSEKSTTQKTGCDNCKLYKCMNEASKGIQQVKEYIKGIQKLEKPVA